MYIYNIRCFNRWYKQWKDFKLRNKELIYFYIIVSLSDQITFQLLNQQLQHSNLYK